MKALPQSRTFPRPLPNIVTIVIVLLSQLAIHAQTLTGTMEAIEHPSYAGISSQFLVTDARVDGNTIYDGELVLFCTDLSGRSIDEDVSRYPIEFNSWNSPLSVGSLESFDVWDRYGTPQDEALAMAQMNWFVDNYYESHFLGSEATEASQYAFQNVLWEIYADGGTAGGLDLTKGNVDRDRFASYGSSSAPGLWSEMTRMVNAVESSGVTTDYTPVFQIMAVHDERPGYQDYIGLSTNPALMTVPEPSIAMLVGSTGFLLVFRRRRS